MLSRRCLFMFSSWVLNGSTFCISTVRFSLPVYIVMSTTPQKYFLPAKFFSCRSENFFPAKYELPPPIPTRFSKSWETRYSSSSACHSNVTDILRPVEQPRFGGGGEVGGGGKQGFSSPQTTWLEGRGVAFSLPHRAARLQLRCSVASWGSRQRDEKCGTVKCH